MKRPDSIRETLWEIAPPVPTQIRQSLSHIHPVLLQILYNRGIIDPGHMQAFLEGRYIDNTDPFLLADMDTAVSRIQQAIDNEETIFVYGDFDADGVTSTVLLTMALRGLGLEHQQVRPYIPNRVDEGYGLNNEALSKIKELGGDLVITVDCGIRSVAEVEHGNSIGLDMVITDHHNLGPQMPPALAIINPKRLDSAYPETMLAGVGIAYKLAEAVYQQMPQRVTEPIESYLDLVAVGTVADLAPLLGENRKLVIGGLRVLNQLQRPGLAALAQVSSLTPGNISAESIGFGLGPRINAAGRLDHAHKAAKLLAANNMLTAKRLAAELNELNKERRRLTADLSQRAEEMVDPETPILIAGDEAFLPGVVGLVASRLAEKYYKPSIIFEIGAEESRGSCRSIPEFHITDALDETADLLIRHGGHAQAAGLTIRNENLPEFKARMSAMADAQLRDKDLKPTLSVDVEISLDEIDWALYETLLQLEPTGYANPTPVFCSHNVEVLSHRTVGQQGAHLQLSLSDGDRPGSANRMMPAIAFRQGDWANCLPRYVDVAYTINLNEWNGRRNLQLMVQDIRPTAMRTPTVQKTYETA